MRIVGRLVLIAAVGLAVWKVHAVRARLAEGDADPAVERAFQEQLERVPMEIGPYHGEPIAVTERMEALSGADTHLSRFYVHDDGRRIQLYIGGSIRNQENFHAPSYCMPAAGWELLEETTVPFDAYPAEDDDPRMRRLLLQRGAEKMLVYYWFQAGSHIADHEWSIRYLRFLDLLAGAPFRPTVIVTAYAPVRTTVADAEEETRAFLRTIGPPIRSALQVEGE